MLSLWKICVCTIFGVGFAGQWLRANTVETSDDESSTVNATKVKTSSLEIAVERGIEVLRKGAQNYPEHRSCFSCHHQALPLLALSLEPHSRPQDNWKSSTAKLILDFTEKSFEGKQDLMREGKGVGGGALTVAYGLWTMDLARKDRNQTIDAMIEYLIKTQADDGAWNFQSLRPPAASSRAMTSAIAIYGLRSYGAEQDQQSLISIYQKSREWLDETLEANSTLTADHSETLPSHEDIIGLVWLDYMLTKEAIPSRIKRNVGELLRRSQRKDGGWGQKADMPSDAYATGQALLLLAQVEYGDKKSIHDLSFFQNGIEFLLRTHQTDGSWHVATRAKPVQVFFDNGDPHGKDQFISMMATSWATAALANHQTRNRDPLESPRAIQRLQVALEKAINSLDSNPFRP